MTNKQKQFINEYLKCWNATQAAIRAGYSEKTAYSIGPRLLKDVEIKAVIKQRIDENAMTADEALQEMANIARGDITDLMVISHAGFTVELLDGDEVVPEAKNIRKIKQKVTTIIGKKETDDDKEIVETEIEMYDRKDALKTILQHHGQLKDFVENSGETKIIIEYADDWREDNES